MTRLLADEFHGTEITSDLFGVNFLFDKDLIAADSPFSTALDQVGSNLIRYPGGAITERFFDITNPDKTSAYDDLLDANVELIPLTDFLSFASEKGLEVNIVIPTDGFMSVETDENGDRYAEFNVQELETFIEDVLSGTYGDATVKSFEIGNEYWGSGGMSAVEYGRLASEMSTVIDEAIENTSFIEGVEFETKIIVQSGTNFQNSKLDDEYSDTLNGAEILETLTTDYNVEFGDNALWNSGDVNWSMVNDQLIVAQFEQLGTLEHVDGVVAHIYSRAAANQSSRDALLDQITQNWNDEESDKEIYITEWNQRSATDALDGSEDYGLLQAHELLNIVETFSEYDVEAAYAWPLSQNTKTALSYPQNDGELSAPGEMFRMMNETLVGKRPVELVGSTDDETEQSIGDIDAHTFYGDDELVFYFASNSDVDSSTFVDLSGILEDFEDGTVRRLGVAEGQEAGNSRSDAELEDLPIDKLFSDGFLEVELGPREILEVVFKGTDLTEDADLAFQSTITKEANADASFGELVPIIDPASEIAKTDDIVIKDEESSFFDDLQTFLSLPMITFVLNFVA